MFWALVSGVVSGRVVGDDGQVLMGALVKVLSLPDSVQSGGTYTDAKGSFKLRLKPGKYLLVISFIGYRTRILGPLNVGDDEWDLGEIVLKSTAIQVGAVEVEAEPPKISYEGEKKVIRLSEDLTSRSGSTLDALRNVPGVSVDNNDNVRIRNTSNITLLINGHPTTLDVSEALRQIPAASVERIEIITNPSAKYDAEGGVIMNIVLKKQRGRGLSASLMGRIGTYDNYGGSASLGLSSERLKFVLSGNYFNFSHYMDSKTLTRTSTLEYEGEGTRYYSMSPKGVRTSLEYRLKSHMLNLEGNFGLWRFGMGWQGNYSNGKGSVTDVDIGGKRLSAILGYSGKFNSHGLETSFFYGYKDALENTFNFITMGEDTLSGFKRISKGPSYHWRVKFNYAWRRNKHRKVETGYQWDLRESENSTDYYTYISGTYRKESSTLNAVQRRTTHAAYATYGDRILTFSYEVGVRFEKTIRSVTVGDSTYTYDSLMPFPSLHISFSPNPIYQFSVSYSKRIWHPRSWQLTPFVRVIDEITVQRGNPNLRPQESDSYEASYQILLGKRGYTGVELFLRRTYNAINYLPVNEEDQVVYTWVNSGHTLSAGSELYVNWNVFEFLSTNFGFDLYEHRAYSDSLKRSLTYDLKASLTLGRGPVGLQLAVKYFGPRYFPGGYQRSRKVLDLGLRVPLNRSLLLVVQFNDFLHLNRREREVISENFYHFSATSPKWPTLSLMIMYDYNNFRRLQKPRGESDEEEMAPQL
ncbi:MAG: TonB-dependent receptor [Thermotogae bacterium]|nr:TonB-dependent receptor [Thermotogota bacterium]